MKKVVLILAGGKGTRLWPVSRENYPKFFLKIASEKSLLQLAVLRGVKIASAKNVFIVSNREYRFLLKDHLKEGGINFPLENILAEPAGKNTAAAIALGVRVISACGGAENNNPSVFVFPADHLIKDEAKFIASLKKAEEAAGEEYITALGIKPYRAETGYGYIKVKSEEGKGKREKGLNVERFVEKPNLKTAKKFFRSGNYFWNAGIFVASASVFRNEFKKNSPAIWRNFEKWDGKIFEKLNAVYKKLTSISFDYAVMEKTKKAVLVVYDGGWNDLGGWDSVYEVMKKDKKGNAPPRRMRHFSGNVISLDSENNLVYSITEKIISLIGVRDLRIASTDDALLIMQKDRSQDVKRVVENLRGNEALVNHIRVRRPWGSFKTLDRADNYKVKIIQILPGRSLSLQKHKRRSEEWIVLKGKVEVELDGKIHVLKENDRIKIPRGASHRLTNRCSQNAKILELARGSYIEEDDIVRLDDDFGRV